MLKELYRTPSIEKNLTKKDEDVSQIEVATKYCKEFCNPPAPNLNEDNLKKFVSQIDKNQGNMNLNPNEVAKDPNFDPMLDFAVDQMLMNLDINAEVKKFFKEKGNELEKKAREVANVDLTKAENELTNYIELTKMDRKKAKKFLEGWKAKAGDRLAKKEEASEEGLYGGEDQQGTDLVEEEEEGTDPELEDKAEYSGGEGEDPSDASEQKDSKEQEVPVEFQQAIKRAKD